MNRKTVSRLPFILIIILLLAACSGAGSGAPPATTSAEPTAILPTMDAPTVDVPTQVAQATISPSPTFKPTALVESTVLPPPAATATLAPTATATATAPAQATATRGAPGVVVTGEPYVDTWTYGSGVSAAHIQGSLQTTIGFLNALIVDGSGRGALPYLSEWLHGETVSAPEDGAVLGIDTAYVNFEVSWLGGAAGGSQVEAILIYDDGARAAHLIELARSGDAWQIGRVSAR